MATTIDDKLADAEAKLLTGLKVLDLSMWQPGHVATQLLADLGADVLKIEPPGGDRERVMADRVANFYGHKRSLVLDLKQEAQRAHLYDLVREADVVVEGYRPGQADRLGVGYDQLRAINPALVYCSITGYGQTGPLAMSTGHEHNYQAYAGVYVTPKQGGNPVASGALIGNQGAGLAAAFGILAAALCARRTGQGEHVDVSIADLLMSWVAPMGTISERLPAGHSADRAGMGLFATGDGGHVVLGIFTEDHFWGAMCRHIGLDEYAGMNFAERGERAVELNRFITERFAAHTRDGLIAELDPVGVPISPVLTRDEAMAHPHFRARGVIARGPDGDRRLAHPIRYRNHPARAPGQAPAVGQGGDSGFESG
jgi:crotonobetainyl-CoA:carnitine CoA-transferase CaiB-like acyl-CoA transferase